MNKSEKSLTGREGEMEREKRNSNRNEKRGTSDPTDSKKDIQGILGTTYISKFDMQLSNGSILQVSKDPNWILF